MAAKEGEPQVNVNVSAPRKTSPAAVEQKTEAEVPRPLTSVGETEKVVTEVK